MLRAEGAFDAGERSAAELGAPGTSQESGGCTGIGAAPAGGKWLGLDGRSGEKLRKRGAGMMSLLARTTSGNLAAARQAPFRAEGPEVC